MTRYRFDNSIDEKGNRRHLHLLDDKPLTGTSTVVDILAKPLTWWASGKAVETLGWLHPKYSSVEERIMKAKNMLEIIKGLDIKGYLELLDKAYSAHSKSLDVSAKQGTNLHAELEAFVKGRMGIMPIRDYDERIEPFIHWSNENVKEFLWSEGHCYSSILWTGGISDTGALLNDDTTCLIDFKSSREAYASHFIQAAGYSLQIAENGVFNANGDINKKIDEITSLIVVPFGAKKVEPVTRRDIKLHEEAFRQVISLYRLLASYKT